MGKRQVLWAAAQVLTSLWLLLSLYINLLLNIRASNQPDRRNGAAVHGCSSVGVSDFQTRREYLRGGGGGACVRLGARTGRKLIQSFHVS